MPPEFNDLDDDAKALYKDIMSDSAAAGLEGDQGWDDGDEGTPPPQDPPADKDPQDPPATDGEEDPVVLKAQMQELMAKIAKAKEREKKSYKDGQRVRDENAKLKDTMIPKDQVAAIVREELQKTQTKQTIMSTYPEARGFEAEIEKISKETWLSFDQAYFQWKGKIVSDPAYRNQQKAARQTLHGSYSDNLEDSEFDNIFKNWPKKDF